MLSVGIGIDNSRLDRLFKPFSQVEDSTTRLFGGTGIRYLKNTHHPIQHNRKHVLFVLFMCTRFCKL